LSQLDSSIVFEVSAVKPNPFKLAYTRLNFAEAGFIPIGQNFFEKVRPPRKSGADEASAGDQQTQETVS
jgi:hypothetical protein